MPRYSSYPERYVGAVSWPFWPIDFVDANGDFLDPRSHYVDTETGTSVKTIVGPDGQTAVVPNSGYFLEEICFNPPPLIPVPYDPANQVKPNIVTGRS